jgi:hypothetical protein
MLKKLLFVLLLGTVLLGGGYYAARKMDRPLPPSTDAQQSGLISQGLKAARNAIAQPETPASQISKVNQKVPFVVQAPLSNWDDFVFQNACEEASIIMSMGWVKGIQKISPAEAVKEIETIVAFEDRTFGYNTDANLKDVERIFKENLNHQNVRILENVNLDSLLSELQKGNLIIAPVIGRALGNPYFTSPGPIAHMLVITGYDPAAKEFITNDPGTKRGENYRYQENVLFNALWEYPAGKDNPPMPDVRQIKKSVIIVGK